MNTEELRIRNRTGMSIGAVGYIATGLIVNTLLAAVFDSISIVFFGTISSIFAAAFLNRLDRATAQYAAFIKIIYYIFILLIYFGNRSVYGKPYYIGGSDDLFFEERAREYWLGQGIYFPWEDHWPSNIKGFLWLIASILRISNYIGGYHTLAFRVMNTDILLATGCVIYIICRRCLNMKVYQSRAAFLVFSLFPNAIVISSYVFRDTVSVFLLVSGYYFCDKIMQQMTIKGSNITIKGLHFSDAFIFLLICIMSYWTRRELLLYILVILLLSFFRSGRITFSTFLRYIFPVSCLLVLFIVTGVMENVRIKMLSYGDRLITDTQIGGEDALSSIVFSRSIFPVGWLFRTAYALVYPIPVGLFKIITGRINGLSIADFFVALGTCFQVILIPFLIKEIKKWDKLVWTYLMVFLSIIMTTFGFRHFILIYPFQCMLIVRNYYQSTSVYKSKGIARGIALLFILGMSYIMMKLL